jgi:hypothetical protein
MATVISLKQGAGWVRNIGNQFPSATRRGLYSAGLRIMQDLQNDNSLPRDRGTYRAGWRCEQTPDGAEVFNIATHGPFIEHSVRGTNVKIGRAMINALTEWIKRKGIGVTYKPSAKGQWVSGEGRVRKVKPSLEAMRNMAWAIAKSMQKKGIFNSPYGLKPLATAFARNARRYAETEIKHELMKLVTPH